MINIKYIYVTGVFAVYIVAAYIMANALSEKGKELDNSLSAMNNDIAAVKYRIDSARMNLPRLIADSLGRNDSYLYVVENKRTADSLRHVNDSLLSRAYQIARRNSLVTLPRRSTSLFKDYGDNKQIKQIGWKFYKNQKFLKEYDAADQKKGRAEENVRIYFSDSINRYVSDMQSVMDSLLDQKNQLISRHGR